ncbi:MAG: DUF2970 domain-containing protein [Gammaproteobacteria bacterium]|nr:DUF2970 domain-containing protein [Gammaproteobacteria bacterium]
MSNNQSNGFFQAMRSVLAAMIGVQRQENRERDFSSGKLWHFVLAGAIGVALFITVMLLWVQSML